MLSKLFYRHAYIQAYCSKILRAGPFEGLDQDVAVRPLTYLLALLEQHMMEHGGRIMFDTLNKKKSGTENDEGAGEVE